MASLSLGAKYAEGSGVPQSCRKASGLYQLVGAEVMKELGRAPGRFDRQAYVNLVSLRDFATTGRHADEEEREILEYMEMEAESGDPLHMTQMALIYTYGVYGYQIDHSKAVILLEQAHKLQFSRATALLGNMYRHGFGVEVDNATAFSYFQSSHDLVSESISEI